MANTFDEAGAAQHALWLKKESGEHVPNIRSASLHPDYEMKPVPEYGMGVFSVNKRTGKVCEFDPQWWPDEGDGLVLLCRDCFEDGT